MLRAPCIIALALAACDSPGGGGAPADPDAGDPIGDVVSADGAPLVSVCDRWNADRRQRAEGTWTGSASACEPGDYLEPGPMNSLRQVNLFRWLAGLPPVALSPEKSAAAQACALLMHANRSIEHEVPASWSCRVPDAVDAAGLSNLATTSGVEAVDLYMTDEGVPNLGHRRWILSNSLGPIGVGSTSSYSCLHVISGDGHADARWTAWPPPGEVPLQALQISSYLDTDAAGWSIQSDHVDLRQGTVTVTRDGEPLEVDTWTLDQGYGSTFGLGIRPRGWRTTSGSSYTVTIDGAHEPISWTFDVVDCR